MKKLMLAVCLMFGGATFVNAQQQDQPTTPNQTQSTQDQDQDRQQIAISELPDAVTASLESQDYSGWTVGNAYKKTDESKNNMEVYIVELKRGTETKKVKFDRDGNKLDHDKDHDQEKHDQAKDDQK
jgi:hypothetical protein